MTVVTVLLGLVLQRPLPALAQEAVAQEAPSPEIRVLFLAPRASGNRSQEQLEAFMRAVITTPGVLTPVERLDEADMVVQFTDYSRKLTKEGKPQQQWSGNFKIVAPPTRERSRRPPAPEHFSIVVTGPDEWGRRTAVAKLGEVLASALGRQRARVTPEHV